MGEATLEPATDPSVPADHTQFEGVALRRRHRLAAEVLALLYLSLIALIAYATGAVYVLFPELGALCHDVFTRPRGTWASSPLLLAITPVITGAIGIVFTRTLAYGFLSVLLIVGSSFAVLFLLKSPIAPAISAGLLPLVLGVRSWWYPAGILLGTALLAVLSLIWSKLSLRQKWLAPTTHVDVIDDEIEQTHAGWYWLPALLVFIVAAVAVVKVTGLRFVLFPPLVVIGFEMFGHTAICPWAKRPLFLPAACFLTSCGGLFFWKMLGARPLAAACSMAVGIMVLRLFDLHVPPALAVALLPFVMDRPTFMYPVSVATGTLLMTFWFLLYRSLLPRLQRPKPQTK